MKTGEIYDVSDDGKKLLTRTTFDPNPHLKHAENLRALNEAGRGFDGMQHVATIPGFMLELWAQEAGVSVTDEKAMEEVMMRKLASNEFSKLRITGGNI